MADSPNSQNENTKSTKKITKPRKQKAETSSSKASTPSKVSSTPSKSTTPKSKPAIIEEVQASSSKTTTPGKSVEKTVEEVYQKKTQLEHILLRPDTYVGSVESLKDKMWVYDSERQKMVYR